MKNGYIFKNKGYQVMELSVLDSIFSQLKYFDLAVALFYWLIPQIYARLEDKLEDIEIEVIRVAYYGAYPCLGIHYKKPDKTSDLDQIIEEAIKEILIEKPLMDFISYLSTEKTDWKELTTKLLASK